MTYLVVPPPIFFADGTSSFVPDASPSALLFKLQSRTVDLAAWFGQWLPGLQLLQIRGCNLPLERNVLCQCWHHYTRRKRSRVHSHRNLGVFLCGTLSWSEQRSTITSRTFAKTGHLLRLSQQVDPLVFQDFYIISIACDQPSNTATLFGPADFLVQPSETRLERLNGKASLLIRKRLPSFRLDHYLLLARAGLPLPKIRRQTHQVSFCVLVLQTLLPHQI